MRVDTGRLRVVPVELDSSEPGIADDGPTSPGRYIRDQRTRAGMSLEQLAAATKIPVRQLTRLEDDDFSEMHGMVFVKGFYRCCARVLHLDEEHVLGLLYEQEREQMRTRRRDHGPTGPAAVVKSRAWPLPAFMGARTITIAVLVLVIAVLVVVAFTLVGAAGVPNAS